jgi:hypothetical protein
MLAQRRMLCNQVFIGDLDGLIPGVAVHQETDGHRLRINGGPFSITAKVLDSATRSRKGTASMASTSFIPGNGRTVPHGALL